MIEHRLFTEANARAYTPMECEDGGHAQHGNLAEQSLGDWSYKPYRYNAGGGYRFLVTGARCSCTLAQPVGTNCARHN
jgi:hypothetical protein